MFDLTGEWEFQGWEPKGCLNKYNIDPELINTNIKYMHNNQNKCLPS